MEEPWIRLHQNEDLPRGWVRLPEGTPGKAVRLRLGCAEVRASQGEPAPAGELQLARDLWEALSVPYPGLRLRLRRSPPDQVELGPAVGVIYPGRGRLPEREWVERARLYFGHRIGEPGLLGLGFDETIDWEGRRLLGYVIDNRPGRAGEVVKAWFPIPAAVRLTWSIRREVIGGLRELTGNRAFNWIRSIGKWQFYSLLSAVEELKEHLPETRRLQSAADLAAMLARHEVVFVKQTHGIKGRRAAQVRRTTGGFRLCHIQDGVHRERSIPRLEELVVALRQVTGAGRCVVQRGILTAGPEGRPLHFRIVTVRRAEGGWRVAVATACVARKSGTVFTNLANGGADEEPLASLERHYGMSPEEARRSLERMEQLCLIASSALTEAFDPLGMLGFDVLVEQGSHRIWLLEANAVPGWGYPPEIQADLARSQTDLALALTGLGPRGRG
ncbi:MAG: YheC/YheD family protein [Bacillota bacterium]